MGIIYSAKGISKRFGALYALDDVDFDVVRLSLADRQLIDIARALLRALASLFLMNRRHHFTLPKSIVCTKSSEDCATPESG